MTLRLHNQKAGSLRKAASILQHSINNHEYISKKNVAPRMSDDEIKEIGESVGLGLKDTVKDTLPAQRRSKRATAPGKPQQASRDRMRHAADNPCYLCYRFGHTGRDHHLPKEWPDKVDHPSKTVRKEWTIIKKQSKDVNDEEISYHGVAKLHNVNMTSWPTVLQQRGLVMILAECVKLELWVDQTQVGMTCKAADCVTPEKYKPAPWINRSQWNPPYSRWSGSKIWIPSWTSWKLV